MSSGFRAFALAGIAALCGCNCGGPGSQNQPPTVTITSPTSLASYRVGQTIPLSAAAADPEDGALGGASVVWTSSAAGQIATGSTGSLVASGSGAQALTVTATDSKGATGSASVTISVVPANAPYVEVVLPLPGATVSVGEQVDFRCAATAFDGSAIPGSGIGWASVLSGPLPGGTTMRTALTVAGNDVITCTAIDPVLGIAGSASVPLVVTPAPNPALAITSPSRADVSLSRAIASGNPFSAVNAQFQGTAQIFDAPGGPGNADGAITWTVSPGPASAIAIGPAAAYSFPADGDYVLTATVRDTRGNVATASVAIHVVPNVPPYCTITHPGSDGVRIQSALPYTLIGNCTDPETGGAVTPLIWTLSGQTGELGRGATLAYTFPAALNGDAVLDLCAPDPVNAALIGCQARPIRIFTNTAPTGCAILEPAADQVKLPGEVTVLRGTAQDAEDAPADLTYRWSASVNGYLATGANTSTRQLTTSGPQTITLAVTDPWGASCTATVNVRVNDLPAVAITSARQGAAPGTDCLNGPCAASQDVALQATASDLDGIAGLDWTDSLLGSFASSATATLPGAQAIAGKHTLVFTALDSLGAPGRDVRDVTLLPAGQPRLAQAITTGGRVQALALGPAAGDVSWVDGNNPTLYLYNAGPQAPRSLDGPGLSLFIQDPGTGPVIFVGLDGNGVDELAGATRTNFRGGLLGQGGNVVRAVAASLALDLAAFGTDNGLVITRASDPNLGTSSVLGKRLLDGDVIRAIAVDPASTPNAARLWAATDAGLAEIGVAVATPFDPVNAATTVTMHVPPEIRSTAVYSVALSPSGRVFAGTDRGFSELGGGGPLLRANPWNLPDELIAALAYESRTIAGSTHELLWAGTRDGLIRYDLALRVPTRFDTNDGLPDNQILSIAVAPAVTRYVGTANGLGSYAGD